MQRNIGAALLAESVGTAMLLCAVIGSGIMAERLSAGNAGVALLANTLATVFALYVPSPASHRKARCRSCWPNSSAAPPEPGWRRCSGRLMTRASNAMTGVTEPPRN